MFEAQGLGFLSRLSGVAARGRWVVCRPGRGTVGWSSRDSMETKKRDWKDGQMGTLKLINDRMKKEGTQDKALRSGMLQAGLGFGR